MMDQEWAWDLGLDGQVRIVVDDRRVETVYRNGRIVARTGVGGGAEGEHVVVIPPRMPVGEETAGRTQALPSREVKVKRDGAGWVATLDGRDLPAMVLAPTVPTGMTAVFEPPAPARSNRKMIALGGIAAGVLALVAVVASSAGAIGTWMDRRALANATHETKLTRQWFSPDSNVSVISPDGFDEQKTDQRGKVSLVRKDNVEAFGAILVQSPTTNDLDDVVRRAASGPIELGQVSPVECNGQPGRGAIGFEPLSAVSGARSKTVICASRRAKSVQVFVYSVPDFLSERDEPVLRDMITHTTFKND